MVQIKEQLVTSRTVTTSGINSRTYITVHETGNQSRGANAQAHANLQSNGNSRAASWQWQVDDKIAIQSFPDNVVCWHAGSSSGNRNSIGVEICVNSDGDFKKAVENAARLIKMLMSKHNIPLNNVVQHNYWSQKNCPTNLRNGSKGINWNQFKAVIAGASSPSPTTTTPTPSKNYLSIGDTGTSVREYQTKLKKLGYTIVVDGSFGQRTLATVKKFQKDNGLVVDGILGQASQSKINELLKPKPTPKPNKPTIKEEEKLELAKSQREEIARIFKKAREIGLFSSAEHEKSIVDGTMTVSRLLYLQSIIAGAGINNGKRL